ncbi:MULTISPECIES: AMP-binding protein [Cyanophyceae]|uniref:AMP-binding protein n=1 Tax=Cyanophyceae TaxID=3028117 RepID=UPI0016833054|nr:MULTISPECIES: AMP-binding protein [Cyanophyceae]MBD1919229.1 AMP-binding protein [Phormidium sp. FACHB-77]MBD2030977.1 AMP-binding protein [Phormidium sp. FACHB-322]MBD2054252.1 AMP-binding protein [Leptolyngbya sp. FACHB-60]
MGQTLKALLQTRWGDDWLIGPSSQEFWQRLSELTPVFATYRESCGSHTPGVLIAEPDPLQFLATCMAAWSEGCTVVLVNPRWSDRERQQVQALVNPKWDAPVGLKIKSYPCQVAASQPGQILIPTGGSSGQIKFAVHSWDTLNVSIEGFRSHFGVGAVQSYCVLPLFHVSGLMQALRVLASGGCLALQSYSDLKGGKRAALPSGGFLSLVPTQLQELLALGGEFIPWLRSFRAVLLGGAPAWRSLLDQAQADQIPVALTYGMTETAAQVATLLPEEFLAGHRSSGRPLPHVNLTILNDQGQPQRSGQPGKIVIRSNSLAQGYLPSAGAAIAANSLTTDDIGYLNDGGYLYIVGRSSTKIITGGENVFPEEIEAVLLATGWVSDACVVGLPCDHWGQRLCALVVINSPNLLHDLPDRLRSRLAPYKLPKQWILISALPRTAQGKLSRPQSLALAQKILGMDG